MTNVDQFESVFRSAARDPFAHERVEIRSIMIVTDLSATGAETFAEEVRRFLHVLESEAAGDATAWRTVSGGEFRNVSDLLALVEEEEPDLVCIYRHLHDEAGWERPYTLGDHVEVLTQATTRPVLVLPHPGADRAAARVRTGTAVVMAITDHLAGDDRLVNVAARLVEPGGRLLLTHVEDEAALERILDAISKIPEIDTDVARREIRRQLLKEPQDFVSSCRLALEKAGLSLRVDEIVTVGRRLAAYTHVVEVHDVDLLVVNTKDEDQLAMHGVAHPLAVELRNVPLLML